MKSFQALAVLIVLASLLTAGAFAWIVRVPVTQHVTVTAGTSEPLFELTSGRSISQTLRPQTDGLSGIELIFGTFARNNSAILDVTLAHADEPQSSLVRRQLLTAELVDNQSHHLGFPPLDDSAGKEFILTLTSPDGVPGNAVTVYSSPTDVYPGGTLFTDGAPQMGDLLLTLDYHPRAFDFLTANPSHLLKMRSPEDALKLVGVYVLALASTVLGVGMMAWVVRRSAREGSRDFAIAVALTVGLFWLVGLWLASGRF